MSIHVGAEGVTREVSSTYIGAEGVTRDVKHGFCGAEGVTRRFFGVDKVDYITISSVVYQGQPWSDGSWGTNETITTTKIPDYGSVVINGDQVIATALSSRALKVYFVFQAVLNDGRKLKLYDLESAGHSVSVTCSATVTKEGSGWAAMCKLNGESVLPTSYVANQTYTTTASGFSSSVYTASLVPYSLTTSPSPWVTLTANFTATVDGETVPVDLGNVSYGGVINPVCITGYSIIPSEATRNTSTGSWNTNGDRVDKVNYLIGTFEEHDGSFKDGYNMLIGPKYLSIWIMAMPNKGLRVNITLGVKGGNGIYRSLYDYMLENSIALDPSPISTITCGCISNIASNDNLFRAQWESTIIVPMPYEYGTQYKVNNPLLKSSSTNFILIAGLGTGTTHTVEATFATPTTPWLPIDFTQSKWLQ